MVTRRIIDLPVPVVVQCIYLQISGIPVVIRAVKLGGPARIPRVGRAAVPYAHHTAVEPVVAFADADFISNVVVVADVVGAGGIFQAEYIVRVLWWMRAAYPHQNPSPIRLILPHANQVDGAALEQQPCPIKVMCQRLR